MHSSQSPRPAENRRRGKLISLVFAAGGLALAIYLLADAGVEEVLTTALAAGWTIFAVSLFRFFPLGLDALAWRGLLQGDQRISTTATLVARWIGESVNTLLPVAQVGGDVLRARLLAGRLRNDDAKPGHIAGASVAVDFILGLLTQVIFTLVGLFLLATMVGGGGKEWDSTVTSLFSVAIAAGILIALAIAAVRSGAASALIKRLATAAPRRALAGLADSVSGLDDQMARIVSRSGSLASGLAIKTAAWFVRAGEIYIICLAIGAPVSPAEAVIMESIAMAVRSAAFAIPGALGAQEGGLLLAGGLLGLGEPTALVIAVIKRAREIITSLPGLAAWMIWERRAS